MSFLKLILGFVATLIIALFAGALGMATVGGRDIGLFGIALLFFIGPAALAGTLLAYPISRSLAAGQGTTRRVWFVLSAAFCGWFFSALSLYLFLGAPDPHYLGLPRSKGPYVYVPGKDFYVALQPTLPQVAEDGEPVPVTLQWSYGTWDRVRQADVPAGVTSFEAQPPPDDARLTSAPTLLADPPGCMTVQSFDAHAGTATVVFAKSAALCHVVGAVTVTATGITVKRPSVAVQVQPKTTWPPMPSPTPLRTTMDCQRNGSTVRCRADAHPPTAP